MSLPIFVGSAFVAQYPQGGGNSWVPMQWLLGLLEQGHDAWWLEYLWTRGDPAIDRAYIDLFWQYVRRYGVGDRVVLGYFPTGSKDEPAALPVFKRGWNSRGPVCPCKTFRAEQAASGLSPHLLRLVRR